MYSAAGRVPDWDFDACLRREFGAKSVEVRRLDRPYIGMSSPQANCPSCGAPVTFRWSSAVQTVCPFCHSILVRDDLILKNVGKVADLPPDPSPIQLLTSGTYNNKKFDVIGRIIYEYEQGGWNEWHIVFSDGTSGWLSDAQLQYAVSFLVPSGMPLPPEEQIKRGSRLTFVNIRVRSFDHDNGELQRRRGRAAFSLLRQIEHAVCGSAHAAVTISRRSIIATSLRRCCSSARRCRMKRCSSRTSANSRDGHDQHALIEPRPSGAVSDVLPSGRPSRRQNEGDVSALTAAAPLNFAASGMRSLSSARSA